MNLLLMEAYKAGEPAIVKVSDFGLCCPDWNESREMTVNVGTAHWMAPEIHLKQPYKGKSVDLFASAIILFIMVAQHPPFTTAQPNDPFYRCLAANRADIFWRTHCKNKPGKEAYFSEEFKDII